MSRSRQTSNSLRVRASMPRGRVDDHDGGVDGGQRAVGVLGEVLMAGRIEQVEDRAGMLERHHRGDDRDAAFALHLHPVGPGLATARLGADLAGKLDGAAEEQQLFGQRGLAGVRMRDDRETCGGARLLRIGSSARVAPSVQPRRKSGAQGRDRATDTRIFNRDVVVPGVVVQVRCIPLCRRSLPFWHSFHGLRLLLYSRQAATHVLPEGWGIWQSG